MGKMQQKRKSNEQVAMPSDPIICPFCGARSRYEKFCSSCGAKFNKEVLAHTVRESRDSRSDYIGPFKTKTAKILLWIFMGLMVLAFVLKNLFLFLQQKIPRHFYKYIMMRE